MQRERRIGEGGAGRAALIGCALLLVGWLMLLPLVVLFVEAFAAGAAAARDLRVARFGDNMRNVAVTEGDMPRVLKDYSDDAVLLTPQGALLGHEGVESFYAQALAMLPGLQLSATSVVSGGNALLVNWTASSSTGSISDGVDTFVFADDSIKVQTSCFTVQPG